MPVMYPTKSEDARLAALGAIIVARYQEALANAYSIGEVAEELAKKRLVLNLGTILGPQGLEALIPQSAPAAQSIDGHVANGDTQTGNYTLMPKKTAPQEIPPEWATPGATGRDTNVLANHRGEYIPIVGDYLRNHRSVTVNRLAAELRSRGVANISGGALYSAISHHGYKVDTKGNLKKEPKKKTKGWSLPNLLAA